jgi:hypothetical protein
VTLSTPARKLLYVSPCWVGKTHDYRLFQVEFPPEQPWFEHFRLRVDLGFLGIATDYVCKEVLIPHKKPRKQELTPEQKAENKVLASQRIVVEHAHAGLKRYRILSDRLRMHNLVLYDVVLGVCAGLWNFVIAQ